jgi:beta-glucanase (GH16 family)
MQRLIASFFFILVASSVCLGTGWDPSNFLYNPGSNYQLVWQDQFENVGPVKGIINGAPAYAPNPKNWVLKIGNINGGLQNYTDSIENAYVQNGQLTIVAKKEGYSSAMLSSVDLQQFTFAKFAAKIRLPYSKGLWPAWWLVGNAWNKYKLYWPTVGEIDILEMVGGNVWGQPGDEIAHGTVHWNNASNEMNPLYHTSQGKTFKTSDGSKLHDNDLVYWTEWTPTNINIGVNEFTYFQFNTTNIPGSINPVNAFTGMWPYYMILNIAIGGSWPGSPDNTTVWPQEMVVDWVRVDQLKESMSGK